MSNVGNSLLGAINLPSLTGGIPMPSPTALQQSVPMAAPSPAPQQIDASGGPGMPKPGDIVKFHKFMGGDPANPDSWAPVEGSDFLHELGQTNPTLAIRVKAIAEGREPMPSTSRINPFNRMLANAVAHYDPEGYDSINNGTRAKLRADFTSGTSALNIRNLNQAIGHLQAMVDEAPNVAGHGGKGSYLGPLAVPLNSLINTTESASGDQGISNYDVAKRALAGELAALFKGKGASSENEVQGWLDQLSANQSTDQKFGTARKLSELLKSRLDELHQQYKQGMGTTSQPFEALNPLAADAYKRLSVIGKATDGDGQSAAVAPPHPADIDAILKKYGGQ